MRVRFVPPYMAIPRVSLANLLENPAEAAKFAGKVVFAGVTAQTEHDRLFSPYSNGTPTSGIEINADAFETMAHGLFLTDVRLLDGVAFAALLVAAAGLTFAYIPGWAGQSSPRSYLAAGSVMPYVFFTRNLVFSFTITVLAAWFR